MYLHDLRVYDAVKDIAALDEIRNYDPHPSAVAHTLWPVFSLNYQRKYVLVAVPAGYVYPDEGAGSTRVVDVALHSTYDGLSLVEATGAHSTTRVLGQYPNQRLGRTHRYTSDGQCYAPREFIQVGFGGGADPVTELTLDSGGRSVDIYGTGQLVISRTDGVLPGYNDMQEIAPSAWSVLATTGYPRVDHTGLSAPWGSGGTNVTVAETYPPKPNPMVATNAVGLQLNILGQVTVAESTQIELAIYAVTVDRDAPPDTVRPLVAELVARYRALSSYARPFAVTSAAPAELVLEVPRMLEFTAGTATVFTKDGVTSQEVTVTAVTTSTLVLAVDSPLVTGYVVMTDRLALSIVDMPTDACALVANGTTRLSVDEGGSVIATGDTRQTPPAYLYLPEYAVSIVDDARTTWSNRDECGLMTDLPRRDTAGPLSFTDTALTAFSGRCKVVFDVGNDGVLDALFEGYDVDITISARDFHVTVPAVLLRGGSGKNPRAKSTVELDLPGTVFNPDSWLMTVYFNNPRVDATRGTTRALVIYGYRVYQVTPEIYEVDGSSSFAVKTTTARGSILRQYDHTGNALSEEHESQLSTASAACYVWDDVAGSCSQVGVPLANGYTRSMVLTATTSRRRNDMLVTVITHGGPVPGTASTSITGAAVIVNAGHGQTTITGMAQITIGGPVVCVPTFVPISGLSIVPISGLSSLVDFDATGNNDGTSQVGELGLKCVYTST
jgi:hypothetical protein